MILPLQFLSPWVDPSVVSGDMFWDDVIANVRIEYLSAFHLYCVSSFQSKWFTDETHGTQACKWDLVSGLL